jgi:transposase
MNNPCIITKWVNDYRIAGPDALRPKKKGRRPKVAKQKKKQLPQTEKEQADAEYLRQLEEENLKLRIENAYLKELRRLRLEDEAKNGKRG